MNAEETLKPSTEFLEKTRFSWAIFMAVFVFFVLIGLTFSGWWFTKRVTERQARSTFDAQVTEIEFAMREHVGASLEILFDLQALFEASSTVDRSEWQAFIERQRHKGNFLRGVNRLDFVEYVKHPEKAAFIQRVQSDTSVHPEGYPDFSIHPSSEKNEYYVSAYLTPFRGNESAFGLDHGSYPNRLNAIEKARDLNEPQATDQTILVTDPEKQPAFFIFLPIYQNGSPISTISERQAALKGFVTGIFRFHEMFLKILERKKLFPGLAFKVFEGDEFNQYLAEEHLIYQNIPEQSEDGAAASPRFTTLVSLNVAGRIWTIYFYTSGQFVLPRYYELLPLVVLLGGFAFSILIFAFLYSLATSRSQAVQIAKKMTQQLRESEEQFRSVAQSANDAIITANSAGNIIAWNRGAEKIFGYSEEAVLGKALTFIMPERFRAAHLEGIKRMNTTGETHVIGKSVELVGLRKDGSEFPIEVSLSSWRTNQGVFFAGILRDITERKYAQGVLMQKTEELLRINTELGRFNRVAVGRELKMIELKREINELCRQLGKEPAYNLSFADDATEKDQFRDT